MSQRQSRSRLLIFAKYPRPGDVKTRLVPPLSFEESSGLYEAFLFDSLDLYASLRPETEPVLYLTNRDDLEPMRELLFMTGHDQLDIRVQRGSGLGERLESAFDDAFGDGCPIACAIGTDHPTLPLDYVRRALDGSGGHDMAIGPADDGGYYLLALRSPHPGLFRGMPYSTPGLYAATIDAARREDLRVLELPLWYDVDDAASLRRLFGDRHLLPAGSRTAAMLPHLERYNNGTGEEKTDGTGSSSPLSS